MTKRRRYSVLIVCFLVVFTGILVKYYVEKKKTEATVYELKERKGHSKQTAEWAVTKKQAALLISALKNNPTDSKSALSLVSLYIKEARISGDYMYYDFAAMKEIENILSRDSLNFNALIYKALIQMSQHHFSEGLVTAEKARSLNPYNAFVYGILVDGHVEMGDYTEAVANADKMVSIRPDLSSYSRISYLREIHGDLPGAIDAMKMAVTAGAPGDESTEWSRVQLAHLYENTGALDYAKMHYTIAGNHRPGYPYALAGLARVALAENDKKNALLYYEQADSAINDYVIKQQLASVYEMAGEKQKAAAINKTIVEAMSRDSKNSQDDAQLGHYSDRELAYAYLRTNDLRKALEHAQLEYNRRPENIDVNETLAWVYYKRGEYQKALPYMQKALRTGCKNPSILCHAGLIYAKAGQPLLAKSNLSEALKSNPIIEQDLKAECLNTLHAL